MTTTAPARSHGFDRQHSLLQLDCSADLRHYSRNLGPGVQERIFQTTSDALRKQLDEHRDFLLRHQQQQPRLAPAPVVSGPAPGTPHAYTQPHPYPQVSQPPLQAAAPQQLVHRRAEPAIVPGDINTYPLALRDALYAQKLIPRAHDGRTAFHVVTSSKNRDMGEDTKVVGTCGTMLAANELAAWYFVEHCMGDVAEAKFTQLASGALHCGAGPHNVYVQEGRME
ncbi:hypothetical protein CC77DRAFT_1030899 [Alternaria alternata]|jgi:hypothetical protein|uniref:Uncharacterized protein n=2 Tax=Alternaria alternata complex TaxID=187734 RepID=A0A177DQM0_ALTAL|nr:hypothetical protein CC77DRAFT_1030899 [Alternaria alternata]XP_051586538.1 uncharacterized protein J4E82_007514 [Alternaria postmessia]RYN19564.1 hypothetical protein AA0115_g10656 [Alternaria tenuissima]KAI5373835.1 hypothetical protein J4E82_007514 [Alternaria postmessia]OAG21302.1 hypothetical protein CC77DRAFT_1030899 [Alternaria alternata]OWY48188.1 hypothetical protein AALT_g10633 [Alternaria alternata]RYN56030.1 hypothetical protein AA0118_g8453 [Alternaria tenuissima]